MQTQTAPQTFTNDDDLMTPVEVDSRNRYFVRPEPDVHQAVCVDVEDLGIVEPKNPAYKAQRKIQFVFQLETRITPDMIKAAKAEKGLPTELDEMDEKKVGQRLTVRSRQFTFTRSEKGSLLPFLAQWRGSQFTRQELADKNAVGFHLPSYLGRNAQLSIVHNPSEDGQTIYANIGSIMAWPAKFGQEIAGEDFTRKKDRVPYDPDAKAVKAAEKQTAVASAGELTNDISDADIPFGMV